MDAARLFLKEIEMLILQQVDFVLSGTVNEKGSASDDWDAVLEKYNDSRSQILTRAGNALQTGLARGVLPEEVTKSLAAINELARPALAHLEIQFADAIERDPTLAKRVAHISNYLEKLSDLRRSKAVAAAELFVDPVWEEETKPEIIVPQKSA